MALKADKRYPFLAEPPCIGHSRDKPPPPPQDKRFKF